MAENGRVTVVEGGYVQRRGAFSAIGDLFREASRWHELIRTPYGIWPALLCTVSFFLVTIDQFAFTLAGPNIAQDLNLDLRLIGGIIATVNTIAIVATLAGGWLGDRVRRTWMIAAGTIFTGVGALLQSRAQAVGVYSAARVVSTVSDEVANVPNFSLIADWYPLRVRGRVFALQSVGGLAAALFGNVALGVVLLHFGWRPVTAALAVPMILSGVAFLVMKEPVRGYFEKRQMGVDEEQARKEDPAQSFGEAWRATFSVRSVRRLFVSDLIQSSGTVAFTSLSAFFLADVYHVDIQTRALVVAPGLLCSVLGAFLGGGLLDVFSRRAPASMVRVIAVFQLIALSGFCIGAIAPPLWVLVLALCVADFGLALTGPAYNSIYSQVIPPAIRTQGLQVINLARLPSLAITGAVYFPLAQDYGFQTAFAVALPLVLLGAAVLFTAGDFFETDRRNMLTATTALEEARQARAGGRTKLLVCRRVCAGYEGNRVLFDVDLELEEGEILALLGTNGAGKSTLLKAISGVQEATDGAIVVDGRDITHMPPHEIARRGVVHMPGGRGVFPGLTVDENLRLGTLTAPGANAGRLLQDAYRAFPTLQRRRDALAGMLSGGEQQMLSLAQAFMARPRLLMIDELSLGLAPAVVEELLQKVQEINARGTTVIVVEQSVNVALTIAKRAVFMEKGEVKFSGPTAELLRRPDVLRAVYVKGTGGITGGGEQADRRRRAQLEAAPAVLEVRELTKSYGGVRALDGVSLTLREGEILGLVGPNGSGKTTLLDIVSGYQRGDGGAVTYLGHDVTGLAPQALARRGLVRRFQDARLFPSLTVFESLLVALDQRLEVKNGAAVAVQLPSARRAERRLRIRAERLIEVLELDAHRDKFVKELSTGLRRILDLAFVLASEPKVLLLDEPSSGIAQAEAESLGPLLRRVRVETGCSMLLIEHDIPLITAVSDELVALVQGRAVTRGPAQAVLNDPAVVEAFLGGSEAAIRRSGVMA